MKITYITNDKQSIDIIRNKICNLYPLCDVNVKLSNNTKPIIITDGDTHNIKIILKNEIEGMI